MRDIKIEDGSYDIKIIDHRKTHTGIGGTYNNIEDAQKSSNDDLEMEKALFKIMGKEGKYESINDTLLSSLVGSKFTMFKEHGKIKYIKK